ncbi:uncharacterized protein LACBIDRAFT_318739 [Laccaria bicolor S238N-H82]|uniref:Predicted protein n=1 Tax=Laccaria bicolor (strain S238N-H82 / ATCC MYA-4686) TaxID=486041 RepID=B0D6Y6_LACBS|nr:uncharacterized protein LACBIDRAFT_318739 [Laccaria bicolor S238N-H82]EDR09556.1 predicted protein [Laccaria bicolor S238N-H82]|eukprot:XP_001879905.1 predicted protein [Laccaria bicolor S238N-H82]
MFILSILRSVKKGTNSCHQPHCLPRQATTSPQSHVFAAATIVIDHIMPLRCLQLHTNAQHI